MFSLAAYISEEGGGDGREDTLLGWRSNFELACLHHSWQDSEHRDQEVKDCDKHPLPSSSDLGKLRQGRSLAAIYKTP